MFYLFGSPIGASIIVNAENLSQQQIDYAVKKEVLPEPEAVEGKYAQIFCNHGTGEVWYEYFDIPEAS